MPNFDGQNPGQYLNNQLSKLLNLKNELDEKQAELDRVFKRRTEIHEGAPASEGEVQELDAKFLKCADEIHKIGDQIEEIQESINALR